VIERPAVSAAIDAAILSYWQCLVYHQGLRICGSGVRTCRPSMGANRPGVRRVDGTLIASAPAESEVDFQVASKSFHAVYNPWRVDLFTAGASMAIANFSTYLAYRAAAHLLNTFAAKSFRLVTG
jgi:hypothetical protein